MLDLRESGPGFIAPAHLLENVGKNKILARFIRLTGNGAALDCASFLETMLVHAQERRLVQAIHVMDVETADLAKRSFSFRDIVFLRVKFPEGERRLDVPPIIASKFLDGQQRGIGTLRFAQQFGIETDQAPDARIITTGLDENLESAGGVVCLEPHLAHIEWGEPSRGAGSP